MTTRLQPANKIAGRKMRPRRIRSENMQGKSSRSYQIVIMYIHRQAMAIGQFVLPLRRRSKISRWIVASPSQSELKRHRRPNQERETMIMASTHIHHPDLPGNSSANATGGSLNAKSDHPVIAPGEIAIGVVIGRASEYFDFFVYAIASVLVFPTVFFPFEPRLEGTLYAFVIFSFAFLARPIGTVVFMAI